MIIDHRSFVFSRLRFFVHPRTSFYTVFRGYSSVTILILTQRDILLLSVVRSLQMPPSVPSRHMVVIGPRMGMYFGTWFPQSSIYILALCTSNLCYPRPSLRIDQRPGSARIRPMTPYAHDLYPEGWELRNELGNDFGGLAIIDHRSPAPS